MFLVSLRYVKKVYDEIHGFINLTDTELKIIDTPTFQRLRRIKQLAFAYYVYPGATHTRFSHSLGSMHVMGMIAEKLYSQGFIHRDDIELLRITALLHDVGHTPFSHSIETFYKELLKAYEAYHTNLSVMVINNDPYISEILAESGYDAKEISSILTGVHKEPVFNYLLSSDLDVDRMDYLLRDSHHTGVAYGLIDLHRLVDTLTIKDGSPVILEKGIHAVENFYLARLHMYRTVYYHKTVVSFEIMVRLIFDRLTTEISELKKYRSLQHIEKMIKEGKIYLWEDEWLHSQMHNALEINYVSEYLKDLINKFLKREGLKVLVDKTTMEFKPLRREHDNFIDELESLIAKLRRKGVPKEYMVLFIDNVPIINEEEAVNVVREGGDVIPIFELDSSIIKYIPRHYNLRRLYIYPQYVKYAKEVI